MRLTSSLSRLIEIAGHHLQHDWWIIGGAATALYTDDGGHDLHDIDVLVSPDDARQLIERLEIRDRTDGGTTRFRSAVYATWPLPLPVDFLGGFEVNVGGTWTPIAPTTREQFPTAVGPVYLPSLEEHIEITKMLGRPRDFERIEQLQAIHSP